MLKDKYHAGEAPSVSFTTGSGKATGEVLMRALERCELEPYYQPIFDLATRRWTSFESLMRWQSVELGRPVPPLELLAVAEECQLIAQLTQLSVHHAVQSLQLLRTIVEHNAYHELSTFQIHINITATLMMDDFFPTFLDQAVEASIRPQLVLELVKERTGGDVRALKAGPRRLTEGLNRLKNMGFRLSLDNAGGGCHTLDILLHDEPLGKTFLELFDTLKVDKSLVSPGGFNSEELPDEGAIKSLVLALQKPKDSDPLSGGGTDSRSPVIVCQCVETKAQLEALRTIEGLTHGQGWLVEREMPFKQALDKLLEKNRQGVA
eukprot:4630250-Prymnesium_polylepis.1